MTRKPKQPKITVRGVRAVERALHDGLPLYVLNPQRGWVATSLTTAARHYAHPDATLASFGIEEGQAPA